MHILVYKNRKTSLADAEGHMKIRQLDFSLSNSGGLKSPLGNVYLAGTTDVDGVQRDDWVMLINRKPGADPGFDRQIAFYRVIDASSPTGSIPASLTLDGPDFNFYNPNNVETFIVHLKDVIGVYERTFEPEFESNWNISN
jgi:hypothetical protein